MPYIEKIPDEKLPTWLSENRLMLWTLRALRGSGGRADLDALYERLGKSLRIPQDLWEREYPPEAEQEGPVVRHRMQFALTDLGFLELVHTDNQGTWSLLDEGADFLKPLDEEDAPRAERDWSRKTGIKLTPPRGSLNANSSHVNERNIRSVSERRSHRRYRLLSQLAGQLK